VQCPSPSRTLGRLRNGQGRADELSALLVATHDKVQAAKAAGKCSLPTRTLYPITRRDDVLRFASDFSSSFDNNLAERDLRMVKLQQKISGCYRTEAGATNYLAIRCYISTIRKQGINALGALRDLSEGKPFMPGVAQG
jgi:hypothetical protein